MSKRLRSLINHWMESFEGLSGEVWLLSLITLINRSGTVVVLFLSIYLTSELGFTKSQAGVVIGCFGVGSFFGNLTGGFLTDRIGYYKVMLGSLFTVGFFFFGMMYIEAFLPFCVIVFFSSLIGDMYNPAANASVAAYSKKENHSRTLSLIRMAINLGFAIGSAAVGFIAGSFGYDWLFIIDGVTCMVAAAAFLLLMDNKKEIPETVEQERNDTAPRSAYRDMWFLMFVLALMCCSISFFQLFTAFPVYLKGELGFTEGQIGAVMALNGIVLFIFEMPIVHELAKRGKEMPSLIWGAFLIGCSYLLYVLFGGAVWVIILAMLVIAFGEILNFPFSTAVALSRSHPSNRGQYMGVFSMGFSVVFIFAPWAGMRVVEIWGFSILWSSLTVLAMFSAVALYLLARRYHSHKDESAATTAEGVLDATLAKVE